MTWYARDINYDGISSMNFGLFLCNMNSGSSKNQNVSGNIKLHTDKTPLMNYNYLTGVENEGSLNFEMILGSEVPIDRLTLSSIQNWLIGRNEFKELCILQDDMNHIIYNCIFTSCELITFANVPYAIKINGTTDSAYGREREKTYTYNINSNTIIRLMNVSHEQGYTYPKIEFTCNTSNGYVSIINENNNNYETKIENLLSGETIIMDSRTQVLTTSSAGLYRLGDFNKHWLELVPKMNKLIVSGNITELKITYANIRKCL